MQLQYGRPMNLRILLRTVYA